MKRTRRRKQNKYVTVKDNYGEHKEKHQINVWNRKKKIKIHRELYVSSLFTTPNSKISNRSFMRLKRWQTIQVVRNSEHAERPTTNRQENMTDI
jgi:hypothetical protein